MPIKLVLASGSPRRAELLGAMGLEFSVMVSDAAETSEGTPTEIVMANARQKALAVRHMSEALIIGADTIVVLDGVIYGKPSDEEDAARMLAALSGRTHEVYTGVCLTGGEGVELCEVSVTRVTFGDISQEEIRRYIATGDPLDKAGAYGIQGVARMFVERVEGSWDGVMGLPTALVRHMLRDSCFNGW